MLLSIWHDYLYTPLLNFLVLLYNGPAYYNLGVAVIYLTIILRVLLLPLSIIEERQKGRYQELNKKMEAIEKDYKNDKVKQKEMIRNLIKEYRVNPWLRVIILGIQLLVLILLYQAFVGGINLTPYSVLYPWISRPDFINTKFLGLDIAKQSLILSGGVGIILFLEIYFEQRKRVKWLNKSDILYRYLFPLSSFLILSWLPAVKSIFILTSMLFTVSIGLAHFAYSRIFR